jgi:DNA-binding CsgD family transcriptional regulator
MDEPKAKPASRPTSSPAARKSAIGRYAELYPSLTERLKLSLDYVPAPMRERLEALNAQTAAREGQELEILAEKYRLTPAEARLAMHLGEGGSLADYAEAAGVAIGTARTQLKSIFAKTGVNRQAALAGLIHRRD